MTTAQNTNDLLIPMVITYICCLLFLSGGVIFAFIGFIKYRKVQAFYKKYPSLLKLNGKSQNVLTLQLLGQLTQIFISNNQDEAASILNYIEYKIRTNNIIPPKYHNIEYRKLIEINHCLEDITDSLTWMGKQEEFSRAADYKQLSQVIANLLRYSNPKGPYSGITTIG